VTLFTVGFGEGTAMFVDGCGEELTSVLLPPLFLSAHEVKAQRVNIIITAMKIVFIICFTIPLGNASASYHFLFGQYVRVCGCRCCIIHGTSGNFTARDRRQVFLAVTPQCHKLSADFYSILMESHL